METLLKQLEEMMSNVKVEDLSPEGAALVVAMAQLEATKTQTAQLQRIADALYSKDPDGNVEAIGESLRWLAVSVDRAAIY